MTRFPTILMDPPWNESGGGKSKRGADRHYPLITTKAKLLQVVATAPVWRPADNCHLYCWVTDNFEDWYHWLIGELGFEHKRSLPWTKPGPPGIGQYFRGEHELLKFAVKGKGYAVRTERRDMGTGALFGIPRREHSQKPEETYPMIEARSHGPYLEMFARNTRPGWESWGNEV